jgi:uncharacterized damage-inducible protein DinB
MSFAEDDVNAAAETATVAAPSPAIAPAPVPVADPAVCPACKEVHPGSDAAVQRQLAQTPATLAKLVKGLDAKGWKRSYGLGKWTIRQIVAHLRDCELAYGVRWRMMISEPDPTLTPFDQDCWASATNYARQDAKQALETLKLLRATNLEMVKLAGKAALARTGNHGEYGTINVGQYLRHMLAHDRNHLGQIEQARAVSGRKRSSAK